METLILLSQTRIRALVARIFLIVAFALQNSAALASQPGQGNAPTFVITAPAQVELGDRIEIQLIVDHAQDLAGYEGQLLFDTSAAHFSGFQQRE